MSEFQNNIVKHWFCLWLAKYHFRSIFRRWKWCCSQNMPITSHFWEKNRINENWCFWPLLKCWILWLKKFYFANFDYTILKCYLLRSKWVFCFCAIFYDQVMTLDLKLSIRATLRYRATHSLDARHYRNF